MSGERILKNLEDVKAYMDVSRQMLLGLLSLGLPVFFVNGRWFSTTAAIDRWMTEFAISNRGKKFCIKNGELDDDEA